MEGVLSDSGAQEASLHATLNAIAFYRALPYGAATPTINVLPPSMPSVGRRSARSRCFRQADAGLTYHP